MSIELFNKMNTFATVPIQREPIYGGWILWANLLVTFARLNVQKLSMLIPEMSLKEINTENLKLIGQIPEKISQSRKKHILRKADLKVAM